MFRVLLAPAALLLLLGPSLACKGQEKNTGTPAATEADQALVRAAVKKDLEGVTAALAKGANPNASSKVLGDGPPLVKLAREDKAFTQALLAKGADVDARRADGDAAIIVASIVGNEDVVKMLLDSGADVNAQNGSGYTALSEAVHNAEAGVAKLLIDKGANLSLGGGKEGARIPFDRALGKSKRTADVEPARVEIVKLILATAKPEQRRLDMAVEAASAWQKTGPNICGVVTALVGAGAEQIALVKAFQAKCQAEGGAPGGAPPPAPAPGAAPKGG